MKKTKSLLRRIFSNVLLLINFGAIIWLLLCYAASVISPNEINYISFFSLTTPFAVLLNLSFVALWLFSSRKWKSLLSAAVLAACWPMVPAVLGLNIFRADDWDKSEQSFKLMTWNVHAMGVFNSARERAYAGAIVNFIKEESPDILCLPEYAINADEKKRRNTSRIKSDNGYTEYFFAEDNDYGQAIRIGTAFFSRYPVVNYKQHPLGKYIYMVQADVQLPAGNVITVFVVHLQSFGLSDNDKALIEAAKKQRNADSISNKSRSFAWKFNRAYCIRASEAEIAAGIIRRNTHPVIVCGDFNDLPFSYTYRTIRAGLNDAFVTRGTGFGRTYNQIIPTLRIDHILYDDAFAVKAFKTHRTDLSDHNPVVVNFEIVDPAKK